MSSSRPYRKAMDSESRNAQLNRFAGIQFDPVVVETLKGIMAAKKKPMVIAKLADYGVEPQPSIKEVGVTLPPPRAAGQIVADIPTLVKKLAEEAKVI